MSMTKKISLAPFQIIRLNFFWVRMYLVLKHVKIHANLCKVVSINFEPRSSS
jgi:hypothetical protein